MCDKVMGASMIYPKLINVKKTNIIMKILVLISVVISFVSIVINELCTREFKWSFIVILGILYTWITTLYSIRKNVNIASHVVIQTICISILVILLDIIIGYKKWSLEIAFPIIIGVANITIFVLTIVSHKKYFKYAIYQLCIFVISMIPVILFFIHITEKWLPMVICSGIAVISFVNTIFLCGKDLKQEMERLFHI